MYLKHMLSVPISYYIDNVKWSNKCKSKEEYLVVMYHRIINKNKINYYIQDGMYVDPSTFRKQIIYLKNHFSIIPLEALPDLGNKKNKSGNKKPYCIITFDDGWNDFYENAYPILKSEQVYSTVFLPTEIIGTNSLFWTDKLALTLKYKNDKSVKYHYTDALLSLSGIIEQVENIQGSKTRIIEKAIQIMKHIPTKDIDSVLDQLADKWGVNIDLQRPSFLSWEEVKEMHDSGIVYFGSHTKSHQILTTCSDDVIRQELVHSKNKLVENNVVSPSFVPFAYPNGNYTQKIAAMVKEAGYSVALTTKRGWNRVEEKQGGLYELKRVGIHQDIASTNSMFACRIFGFF